MHRLLSVFAQSLCSGIIIFSAAPALIAADTNPRLKALMSEMGAEIKAISQQASQAALNDNSARRASHLEELILGAKKELPTTIANLPASEQPAKIAAYKVQLNEALIISTEIENAFLQGDNADVTPHLDRLRAVISAGHAAFRPPHP